MPSTRRPATEPRPLVGLVLAAGLGTRLRPLTDRVAKAVVPFLGRPCLHWALDRLAAAGAVAIGVNAHHLGEQVEACARTWETSRRERGLAELEVRIVPEAALLGTGGGARGIWEALGRPAATAAVVNGDVIVDEPLDRALAAHRRAVTEDGAIATLVCSDQGEGRIFVDRASGIVLGMPGNTGPQGVRDGDEVSYVGSALLEAEALALLPRGPGCLLRDGLVQTLGGERAPRFHLGGGRAIDLGTPERYWNATRQALDARARRDPAAGPQARRLVGPQVRVEEGASLGDYVVLSGATTVSADARLERVVAHDAGLRGELANRLIVGEATLELPAGDG